MNTTESVVRESDAGNATRSPVRTVQVLHELALRPRGMSLAALAAHLQLPKTSLFRLLNSLELGDYVQVVNGQYQIGPATRELGTAIMLNHDFAGRARYILQKLASQCGETVILGTVAPNGLDVIYASVIEGTHPLRFSITAGAAKPLQCSANGQTILAYMPAPELQKFCTEVKFAKYASGSIMTVPALETELARIRSNGIAISINGTHEGVFSIAAPIVDASGRVCAGVSISAPEAQVKGHMDRFDMLVREAGHDISRILAYTGEYPPR
ncbi:MULTISPECIES: IclR family transcriptional regulator [unclassified Herbaspirillum]|uniref:IclR family transcriptional regulator n=1 Tax=unclassified Herbaspirillum TaxID=2624150 RepID=UPI00107279D6|nr:MULTISPECIES: IclR family transcriptional regulator [unclassified Herbaspirillum]TFI08598.1 IclR family transcriptional regulator [Herbaspirillum sp. 3R11]TFI15012.1 IclR family transcriptional regulator [Herbaspirillum sp. 3R-11]TFI20380.1 IclR family transcriptional regulator [Herbaspirillum sp. 3C11]